MKVKLLKKVRKRFYINQYPKGIIDCPGYNLFLLQDERDSCYSVWVQCGVRVDGDKQFCESDLIFSSEKECIDYLKGRIIKKLSGEGYGKRRDKEITGSIKKVWYNK